MSFLTIRQTFEKHYGVEFEGIRKGAVSNNRERLIQFKTNIDVVMSLLDRNGLGDSPRGNRRHRARRREVAHLSLERKNPCL